MNNDINFQNLFPNQLKFLRYIYTSFRNWNTILWEIRTILENCLDFDSCHCQIYWWHAMRPLLESKNKALRGSMDEFTETITVCGFSRSWYGHFLTAESTIILATMIHKYPFIGWMRLMNINKLEVKICLPLYQ